MTVTERGSKRALKNYYEKEAPEAVRLYNFTKPYCYYYDKERMEQILKFVKKEETVNSSLLDVGCGDGSYLRYISCENAVGLDVSKSKLQHARKKCKDRQRYDFIEADAEYLPFRNKSFDIVLASELIEHVPNPIETIREIARACKNKAVISTPTHTTFYCLLRSKLGRPPSKYGRTHIHEFSQQELINAIEEVGLYIKKLVGTPVIDFPGLAILLHGTVRGKKIPLLGRDNYFLARIFYFLNKRLNRIRLFQRYGMFSCVLCVTKEK